MTVKSAMVVVSAMEVSGKAATGTAATGKAASGKAESAAAHEAHGGHPFVVAAEADRCHHGWTAARIRLATGMLRSRAGGAYNIYV